MAQESSWWDGLTDGLSEFGTDLLNGASNYFGMETALAEADKTANENATASQNARIAEMQRQERQDQQRRQTYMFAGAVLIIIAALFAFKK